MKKFTFKGVLDGFRSSSVQLPQQMRPEQEIQETLRSGDFSVKKVSFFYNISFFQIFIFKIYSNNENQL